MKGLNMIHFIKTVIVAICFTSISSWADISPFIQQAVENEFRDGDFKKRDKFRHPAETLAFFEFNHGQTVVEIWPATGWYTEILAPALNGNGTFIAAHFSPESKVQFFRSTRSTFQDKMTGTPAAYNQVKITTLEPPAETQIAEANSADRIYTFRNVHNWMRNNTEQAVFDAMYKALKPGGIMGVVEHRAKPKTTREFMVKSGYVSEDYVISLAETAGFQLTDKSEINANPVDLTDHPNGVWTLPPTLRIDSSSKLRYLAIGESDRMTLKFRKP